LRGHLQGFELQLVGGLARCRATRRDLDCSMVRWHLPRIARQGQTTIGRKASRDMRTLLASSASGDWPKEGREVVVRDRREGRNLGMLNGHGHNLRALR